MGWIKYGFACRESEHGLCGPQCVLCGEVLAEGSGKTARFKRDRRQDIQAIKTSIFRKDLDTQMYKVPEELVLPAAIDMAGEILTQIWLESRGLKFTINKIFDTIWRRDISEDIKQQMVTRNKASDLRNESLLLGLITFIAKLIYFHMINSFCVTLGYDLISNAWR